MDETVEILHIKKSKNGNILCLTVQWRGNVRPLYLTRDFYIAFNVFFLNIERELK